MKKQFMQFPLYTKEHFPITDYKLHKDTAIISEWIHITPRIGEKTAGIRPVEKPILHERSSKRIFDVFLVCFGLLMSSWLWVLIIMAIIIEDGFPVIIRQKRIGKGGAMFNSFKFRSMIKASLNEKTNIQAAENDPRITTTGKCLRRTALDELPQLLNILFGEMSFVGPRPLLPSELEINGDSQITNIASIPGYDNRILIRPGLTGISQVFASRDLPRRHKFKYDLLYLKKAGIVYDLKLIISSFLVTFNGAWEKRSTKLGFLEPRNNHFHHSTSDQK